MPFVRSLLVLSLALLGAAAEVRAAELSLGQREAALRALEAARFDVAGRKAGLELASRAGAAEIERVKAQSTGIVRDARLGELLATARARADELSHLAADLRERDLRLAAERQSLLAEYNRLLGNPGLGDGERALLSGRRATLEVALAAASTAPADLRLAPAAAIDPLEGPSELVDRADRLQDDRDKLEREARRVGDRIAAVEQRLRLRERAAEMGDDLFAEWSVGHRVTRPVTQSTSGAFSDAAQPSRVPPTGNPVPGLSTGGPLATGAAAAAVDSAPPTMYRGVVDPSTLAELRRAEEGGDPEAELHALRKAQADLRGRAEELSRRQEELRRRAATLRRSK